MTDHYRLRICIQRPDGTAVDISHDVPRVEVEQIQCGGKAHLKGILRMLVLDLLATL